MSLIAMPNKVAGANRRWRCQFRCRGSRRESAVAQLFSLGCLATSLLCSRLKASPQIILVSLLMFRHLAQIAASVVVLQTLPHT